MSEVTTDDQASKAEKLLEESFMGFMSNAGLTIRDLKGLSDEDMEAIYAIGYSHFQAGKFDEAEKMFKALVLLDHLEKKYWFAFGGVCEAKRDFARALQAYQTCAFLDIDNPKPQYHCAVCHLALGDKENAINALDALEDYAPKDTELGKRYLAKGAALRAKILGEAK